MTISRNGQRILTLEQWEKLAGPKSADQWQPGRSAMEAARYWLAANSPSVPQELDALLGTNGSFGPLLEWTAEPEARMPFDDFSGEPRNADLLISARDNRGKYLIAVESKADETFGAILGDALTTAFERRLENPRSNAVARIEGLIASLFSARRPPEPALAKMRYQLLTATAGALHAASERGDDRVLLLVQEFVTDRTTPSRQTQNSRDLRNFVRRLSDGAIPEAHEGQIYGPITVPGTMKAERPVALFVGKIRCVVGTATSKK
jgi:hypothetical protein